MLNPPFGMAKSHIIRGHLGGLVLVLVASFTKSPIPCFRFQLGTKNEPGNKHQTSPGWVMLMLMVIIWLMLMVNVND